MHLQTKIRLYALTAGLLALGALAGCGKTQYRGTPPVIRERGSVKVGFNEPTLAVLPAPEGPYVFSKATAPILVELTSVGKQPEVVRLIGLSLDAYPEPEVDAQGKPLPKPDPAEVERKKNALAVYKMGELKKLFGDKAVYIIRMTNPAPQQPSRVYALVPDTAPTPGQPPKGEATLLNALAVRNGMANLDLSPGAEQQPFFDTMLDAQLAGLVEWKSKVGMPEMAEKIWTKFPMELPEPYKGKLAEFEKKK